MAPLSLLGERMGERAGRYGIFARQAGIGQLPDASGQARAGPALIPRPLTLIN